jgi:hypothetical protein
MRRLLSILAPAILSLAAGCGGSRSSTGDAARRGVDADNIIAPSDAAIGIDLSIEIDSSVATSVDGEGIGIEAGGVTSEVSTGIAAIDGAADEPQTTALEVGIPVDEDGSAAAGPEVDTIREDGAGELGPDGAVDMAAGTDVDATTSLCNAPACFTDLMRDCRPSGSCIEQSSGYDTSQCYENGVKVITTVDASALTMSTKVRNGNRTCYETYYDLAAALRGAAVVGLIKDGGGTTVATLGDDMSGRSIVTCTGGQPVVLNEACDSENAPVSTSCNTGPCTP